MKAHIQSLEKVCLTRERMKQLADELSATESHEFRGINGCLQWVTKELLYPFQFVVKVLQRRQGQARVRDLLKANEVIDEIKQHEDFTLTYRVLDLTSCGLIEVFDASLGGVDRFGNLTDQESKNGEGLFTGQKRDFYRREISRGLWVPEANSTCLTVILARSQECVARAWSQKLEVWVCQWTQCSTMEIC